MSFEEYLKCHEFLARVRRWWLRAICLGYGLATVVLGAFFFRNAPRPPWIAFGTVFILYAVFISPIQFRYRVRRIWNQYPAIREPMNMKLNREGITGSDDKGNPLFFAWDGMVGYRETESLFLIYRSPVSPLCLPKRLLPEDEVAGCRDLLEEVLPGAFRDRRADAAGTH